MACPKNGLDFGVDLDEVMRLDWDHYTPSSQAERAVAARSFADAAAKLKKRKRRRK